MVLKVAFLFYPLLTFFCNTTFKKFVVFFSERHFYIVKYCLDIALDTDSYTEQGT